MMAERRLLTVIAVLLLALLIVQVVPAPFLTCRDFGATCERVWWPMGRFVWFR